MTPAVLAVALNPAIDETVTLERLIRGSVHRARSVRYDAGGKGVNVASCLSDWGTAVAATGILGAENAAVFEALFAAKGIDDRFARVAGATRTNIKIVDDAETTDVNLPGARATQAALAAVDAASFAWAHAGGIAVIAGSLPLGAGIERYPAMVAALAARGVRVVLDAAGAALEAALAASVLPFCIKPNRDELEAWCGRALSDRSALHGVARELCARGIGLVAVSLGAEGALFVSAREAVFAKPPAVTVESTVGAGDAMVAGIVAATLARASLAETARLATAFAAGKLTLAGANLPANEVVRAFAAGVVITPATPDGVNA